MGMHQRSAAKTTFFASCELWNSEVLEDPFRSASLARSFWYCVPGVISSPLLQAAPSSGALGVNKPHLTRWKIEAKSNFR